MSHWVILIIYVIEKIARRGHLLNTPVPLTSFLPADVKVA